MNEGRLPTGEQIELRAYELYLERGCEDGRDLADWLAAERELTELSEASASESPRAQAAAAGLHARSGRSVVKKAVGATGTGYRTRKQPVLQPK